MSYIIYDLEVSPNYFLIGMMKENGKKLQIRTSTQLTADDRRLMNNIMREHVFVGFNSARYDDPVLCYAMTGASTKEIYELSQRIIGEGLHPWQTWNIVERLPQLDSVDISEPAPAVFVSLKKYGTRLGSKKLQELPFPYDKVLTNAEKIEIDRYNVNDLRVTKELFDEIRPRIDLRIEMSEQYKTDLRSKSDAQIAETVIVKELTKAKVTITKPTVPKTVTYKAPDCIVFSNMILQGLLKRVTTETFKINPKNGQPMMPEWMKKFPLKLGDTEYTIGLGGLHSKEKSMVVIPTKDEVLRNIDVASYYPSMILEFGFYPKRFTTKFLDVYGDIYKTRLKAKAEKNMVVSDGLKIVLNGSFGKLGSMYSKLYAPDLMLQVTITGQLMLLMLIAELEHHGIAVKSSNTDGVEIICPKSKQELLEAIVCDWELSTGMVMEHGKYRALYARDVNSYVAVYDGYVKAKGVYAEPTLSKDSEYPIVFKAIREYLLTGRKIEHTITECTDINQFVTARAVKYGGWWGGTEYIEQIPSSDWSDDTYAVTRNTKGEIYLGKIVRYYYAVNGQQITYTSPKTGSVNKVAKSDGAFPAMDLPDKIPSNLDYIRYFDIAKKALADLGVDYGL